MKKNNTKSNENMKRKLVVLSGLLIIFLLIDTSIAMASTGYSEKNKTLGVQNDALTQIAGSSKFYQAPKNPDFIKYVNSKASSQISMSKQKTGLIPSPVDLRHLSQIYTTKESFPSKYDLRTLNKVTSVKDQGNAGSCWAFATYGALESYLKPGENRDFSENNLKNVLSNTAPEGFDFTEGGTTSMSTAYFARWSGTVNEKDDPYSDLSTYSPNELKLPVSKHVQDVIFLPSRQGSLDNDGIKSAIKKYGAIDTVICTAGDSFYDYYSTATHSFYYTGSPYSYHAVDIVGWDDNYDKNNFSQVPPGNGAFIVKNSWGTGFGDNGYLYISYYDQYIGETNCVFTAENIDNYNSIYQYDPLGWTNTIGCKSTTCWGANVFTAKSNEILKAVSFYATDSECNYDIYIYTNPTSVPIGGTPVLTQSGTSSTAGYHTVHLNTGVTLKAGQKFSVVIKFTTPNWNAPVAIEQPYSGYSSKAIANSSESFVSCDGNTWYDMTSIVSNTDVCIKAFTSTNTQSPILKITKTANPTTYNTVGQKITYTYTVTNSGNVPASSIAVKDDKATVKISSGTLAPGSSVKGTATYTITQADINAGSVTNSAYATGKFGTKTVTSNKVTATVKAVQKPVLKITKTANPTTYNTVGQKIAYTYTVTNSGNVPVSAIAVKDNKATVKISSSNLAPGSSVKGTATYTITKTDISAGSVTNSAYATGKFGTKTVTSNKVTATVKAVQKPVLKITKTANPTTYKAVGQKIAYTYTVTNSGNVPVSAIAVKDNKATVKISSSNLAPGSSVKGTATYTITKTDISAGTVTNSAYATGKFGTKAVTSSTVKVSIKYKK